MSTKPPTRISSNIVKNHLKHYRTASLESRAPESRLRLQETLQRLQGAARRTHLAVWVLRWWGGEITWNVFQVIIYQYNPGYRNKQYIGYWNIDIGLHQYNPKYLKANQRYTDITRQNEGESWKSFINIQPSTNSRLYHQKESSVPSKLGRTCNRTVLKWWVGTLNHGDVKLR